MYADLSKRMKKTLDLDSSPVAVTFSIEPPEGVEEMTEELRLCQMLDKARLLGESFYTTAANHRCDGGASSCGLKAMGDRVKTGEFLSENLHLFGSRRAARRFSAANPRIEYGTVRVVTFSPLEKALTAPDIVVLVCNPRQAMEIAEASAYETGGRAAGLTGPPICSSIVAAPFLTGEVVYSLGDTGVRKYMRVRDEDVFVGIPAELLANVLENLATMRSFDGS